MEDMDNTAIYLCQNIQGAKFAFVQSDEISVLVTDFDKLDTDAWFDGNIQKIVSVSASMATAKFNQLRTIRHIIDGYDGGSGVVNITARFMEKLEKLPLAEFDARTFTIPMDVEVENYFIWRQQDTVRNSISSVAQSLYSAKQLNGKNTSQLQDMIHEKGQNWNDYEPHYKRGRFIRKVTYLTPEKAERSKWVSLHCPTFTQDREFLITQIPILD